MTQADNYLYFAADLRHSGSLDDESLSGTTERHAVAFTAPPLTAISDPAAELARSTAAGVVFELAAGLPSEAHLALVDDVLRSGRRAWLYWPAERAVECVDSERLDSLRKHLKGVRWLRRVCQPMDRSLTRWHRAPTGLRWIYRGEFPVRRSDILVKLTLLSLRAQPVPLVLPGDGASPLPGVGVYLRTDYWNAAPDVDRMGFIAAELSALSDRLVCLTPRWDDRLARRGVQQVVLDTPRLTVGEDAMVLAPTHYWPIVKAVCQTLRPAYLFERLSAGQSVGAELSQLLDLPYIVEYGGSEAMLREALNGAAPFYPDLYSKAEELSLRQATVILAGSAAMKDELVSRGIDGARVFVPAADAALGAALAAFVAAPARQSRPKDSIETGDSYKDEVQNQWNQNPVGSQHARVSQPHTLEWFLEVEKHRYGTYAPWMPETMEFAAHAGQDVLEVGGGMGTDLAQFAAHGAAVTDVDLAAGHLELARENFRLRNLRGRFVHHDAESLPFDDASFDVVYSNGVLHHTPNTAAAIAEIHRVLRPGGRAIVMLYAENSLHYWRKLVWLFGIKDAMLDHTSMGEIMSRSVERSANEARPLVKVYTKRRARALFKAFDRVEVLQRQLLAEELPAGLKWTLRFAESRLGWNLIVKAIKR